MLNGKLGIAFRRKTCSCTMLSDNKFNKICSVSHCLVRKASVNLFVGWNREQAESGRGACSLGG
jgi:hypothetical protein